VGLRHRSEQLGGTSWLRRRYVEDGASLWIIAAEADCNPATVSRALAAAGVRGTPTAPGAGTRG